MEGAWSASPCWEGQYRKGQDGKGVGLLAQGDVNPHGGTAGPANGTSLVQKFTLCCSSNISAETTQQENADEQN